MRFVLCSGMSWLPKLLNRRPDFGDAWGILVGAMLLATLPLAIILGVIMGLWVQDWTAGLDTMAGVLFGAPIPIAIVSAAVGPFYLGWRDVLLKPTPPYFRTAYVVFVIGPGIPWILLLALVAVVGGPAYPILHLGVLSIIYVVEVIIGGWICARMLAAEGLL